MINAERQDTHWIIPLPEECDLSAAVEDAPRLAEMLVQCAGHTPVRIDAGRVVAMDTAYLQLLRCLMRGFAAQETPVELQQATEPLVRLMRLYGFPTELRNQ
jgi:ABC-type transporter Mla MlaB component